MRPTVYLFADVLAGYGGIETYLDALARKAHADDIDVRIAVSRNGPAPFLEDLRALGIPVYDQRRVPGDRFQLRQRLLIRHVAAALKPGDWVYCVRQPMPEIYLPLVRAVHARGARIGVSWTFSPEFVPAPPGAAGARYRRAVAETDAVVSVAECNQHQYAEMYDYDGPVALVRYHNRELLPAALPLPAAPPYRFAFLGRIDIHQKNIDRIVAAFGALRDAREDVELHFYGGGPDIDSVRAMADAAGLSGAVTLHGRYDHSRDLPEILAANHVFLYTSRFEGGPCLSLLELLQAGRFVIASPVGGIPDIYDGREEAGELVSNEDVGAIRDAMARAVSRIEQGRIDGEAIRRIYRENFHGDIAHRQWLRALELDGAGDGASAAA